MIARALASRPELIIADEPIASLDVSIRAEILDLLDDLVVSHGVGILYITHDLLSAKKISDHALVLSKGRVVESGDAQEVIDHPKDDYTRRLLDAIPQPKGMTARSIGGDAVDQSRTERQIRWPFSGRPRADSRR